MKVDSVIIRSLFTRSILAIQSRFRILQTIRLPTKGSLARHRSRARPTKATGAKHILHPNKRPSICYLTGIALAPYIPYTPQTNIINQTSDIKITDENVPTDAPKPHRTRWTVPTSGPQQWSRRLIKQLALNTFPIMPLWTLNSPMFPIRSHISPEIGIACGPWLSYGWHTFSPFASARTSLTRWPSSLGCVTLRAKSAGQSFFAGY
jgi:hypothetical protein